MAEIIVCGRRKFAPPADKFMLNLKKCAPLFYKTARQLLKPAARAVIIGDDTDGRRRKGFTRCLCDAAQKISAPRGK